MITIHITNDSGEAVKVHTTKINTAPKHLVKAEVVKVKRLPIESNPLIRFSYPSKDGFWTERVVRLISANSTYYLGLDVGDKNRFKKFLRNRANKVELMEFNSEAMS
jgi:hypothetical protein